MRRFAFQTAGSICRWRDELDGRVRKMCGTISNSDLHAIARCVSYVSLSLSFPPVDLIFVVPLTRLFTSSNWQSVSTLGGKKGLLLSSSYGHPGSFELLLLSSQHVSQLRLLFNDLRAVAQIYRIKAEPMRAAIDQPYTIIIPY